MFESTNPLIMKSLLSLLLGVATWSLGIAQDGSLDSTFHSNGKHSFLVENTHSIGDFIEIAPNGQFYTTGVYYQNQWLNFVTKHHPNGVKDSSFADNGTLLLSSGNQFRNVNHPLISPSNKLLLIGGIKQNGQNDFMIRQFLPNGVIDSSFGVNGVSIIDFQGTDDFVRAAKFQGTNHILIVGKAVGKHFAACRIDLNGNLDTTFGSNGLFSSNLGFQAGEFWDLAVLPNNDFFAAGTVELTTDDWLLTKFKSNGSIDSSFGTNGLVVSDFMGQEDVVRSLILQPDGKIVVGGDIFENAGVARYLSNGTVDSTFNSIGWNRISFPGWLTGILELLIQSDDKVIALGGKSDGTGDVFHCYRFTTSGELDSSFAGNGIAEGLWFGQRAYFKTGAITADGKIIALGIDIHPIDSKLGLCRFNGNNFIGLPEQQLVQNFKLYPNPVQGEATLTFNLTQSAKVSIQMIDVLGRPVHNFIQDQERPAGLHEVRLEIPCHLKPGNYFLILQTPFHAATQQLIKVQ